MMKKFIAAAVLSTGCFAFAGLVDHGDYTGFPNVNVDAHLTKIAHKHFPEISKPLPTKGLPRKTAWTQDIKKAAEGLNIKQSDIEAMVNAILDPLKAPAVKAPHEKLLEFELYTAGMRESVMSGKPSTISWKKLLELPLEKRRYTTIPVLYQSYRIENDWSFPKRKTVEAKIKAALDAGCIDTQCCYAAMFTRSIYPSYSGSNSIYNKKLMIRKYFVNFTPQKPWRYTNEMDTFRRVGGRGDGVYSGENWQLPDFVFALKTTNEDILRNECMMDPAIRDFVVAIGLTNRHIPHLRKIAMNLARQSEINYPILALRLPTAEAVELLKNYPQFHNIRDLLIIKGLNGEAKIKAIDEYIAKYPDYTPEDMPKTSIALNTHAELHAIAGAELFKIGKPFEAAERWTKACTPEDIALVAEQVMTIEQLIAFCEKYYPNQLLNEYTFYSDDCAKNNKLLYPDMILSTEEVGVCVKNILARRLMRNGRFADALKYFSGIATRRQAEKFYQLSQIAASPKSSKNEKLMATLNMAALTKQHGDILFGTFLEPDNLLSKNVFPCKWGTKQHVVKLNKPQLPRNHYVFLAAKYYADAAEMSDDPAIKKNALWTAGTLIKKKDPKKADVYFKKLFAIAPELTVKNWFVAEKDAPLETQRFYKTTFFVNGPITSYTPALPPIVPVEFPKKDMSPEALVEYGKKFLNENERTAANIQHVMYAFRLAGEKGFAEGDIWSAIIQYVYLNDYTAALAFLRRAEQRDPNSNFAKHELGHVYHSMGYWAEGIKMFQHVADTETKDQKQLGLACYNLARLYSDGCYGLPKDEEKANRYYDKALKADPALRPR